MSSYTGVSASQRGVAARLAEFHRDQQRSHKRSQEKDQARLEDDLVELVIPAVEASAEMREAFQAQLVEYDTATVVALEENRIALELAQEHLTLLLANAYTLEDGTRVFKAEDGSVFDELGNQLSAEIVDPDSIHDGFTSWEQFTAGVDAVRALEAEQSELHDYQEKLDEAHERLEVDGLTTEELEALDDELHSLMPASVREELGFETTTGPNLTHAFETVSARAPAAASTLQNAPQLGL